RARSQFGSDSPQRVNHAVDQSEHGFASLMETLLVSGQLLNQQREVHFQSRTSLTQLVVNLTRHTSPFVFPHVLQARGQSAQLVGESLLVLLCPLARRKILHHGKKSDEGATRIPEGRVVPFAVDRA